MSTLTLLVALCFLFYGIRGKSNHGLGYLFGNFSLSPFTTNDQSCSAPNAATVRTCSVNYMVEPKYVGVLLPRINETLNALNFYTGVNSSCRESVREYMCSNGLPICDDRNGTLSYNVKTTELACVKAKANCPATVTEDIIFNCTLINEHTVPLARCVHLPSTNGICPTSDYKVTQANVNIYKTVIDGIKPALDVIKGTPLLSNSCKEKIRNLLCYTSGGPACSDDGKLLIHVISRQDCDHAIKTCAGQSMQGTEHFCAKLPNATVAPRVPLPRGLSADAILLVAGEKTSPSKLAVSTTQPSVMSRAPSAPFKISTTKSPSGSASYLSFSYFVSFSSIFLVIIYKYP